MHDGGEGDGGLECPDVWRLVKTMDAQLAKCDALLRRNSEQLGKDDEIIKTAIHAIEALKRADASATALIRCLQDRLRAQEALLSAFGVAIPTETKPIKGQA